MLKVVSNTTPILSLLKLNRLEILKELYKQLYIPFAVFQEIEAGKSRVYYRDLSQETWIKIINLSDNDPLTYRTELDAGEAETIDLAKKLNADLIIIDEKLGRFYAKQERLKVTGTIGILIKAKSENLIDSLEPMLNELIEKGVWISEDFKLEILKSAGE